MKPEKSNWNEHFSEISCALRTAVHSGTGTFPYYLVFGQQVMGSAGSYKLLRELGLLEDRRIFLSREDSMDLVPNQAQKALENVRKKEQEALRYKGLGD